MNATEAGPVTFRGAWLIMLAATRAWCVVLAVLFLAGMTAASYGGTESLGWWLRARGWSPNEVTTSIEAAGWSPQTLISLMLTLECLYAVAGLGAAYLVLRGADSWFRLYLGAVLALHGTMAGVAPAAFDLALGWDDTLIALQGLAWISFFPLVYLLPDGRFVPRWSRWCALAWVGFLLAALITSAIGVPTNDVGEFVVLLGLLLTVLWSGGYRYFRVASPEQQQQIRLVLAAFALRIGFLLATAALPLGPTPEEPASGLTGLVVAVTLSYLIGPIVPVAIVIAVLRHRLFGAEVWLNRTLVYTLLTALVLGGYAGAVATIGVLWPEDSRLATLAVVLVVALAAHPARTRLQRGVDRLVYGQRREPYEVVSALGDRLAVSLPPEQVLDSIVSTIGPALKLRWVAAVVDGPPSLGAIHPRGASEPESASVYEFPLRHEADALGMLRVAARPGEELGAAELTLLERLARQAGVAVHLAVVSAELETAHEQLMTSIAEDRQRLYRDLHDGLGPTLASLFQHVDAARSLVSARPEAATALLVAAAQQIRAVLTDVRRLVHNLQPPELTELGLVAAIERTARQLAPDPDLLAIEVTADVRVEPLPDAVVIAAYRIASEAITNATKHSGAARIQVSVMVGPDPRHLVVRVTDDGVGCTEVRPGTGLPSMRARAEELGGLLEIDADPGFTVTARLPV